MNAAETAAFLRSAAEALEAGEVPEPFVSLQFIITGEPDQDTALRAATSLFPGFAWQARIEEHALLGPAVHVDGREGRTHVTISGDRELTSRAVHEVTDGRPVAVPA